MLNLTNLKDKILDISIPLHENMDRIPGFKGFQVEWQFKIENQQSRNRSRICLESHLGTHVDAPLHFIKDGKPLNKMPLENLIGDAQVIEVDYPETVTAGFLKDQYKGKEIVLFKYGKDRLNRQYDYFDASGVEYLINKNVKVIGTDNYNIDSVGSEWNIHHQVLGNEIFVVEGLELENIEEGFYTFICLPLSIRDIEGAPARAILIKQ